VKGPVQKILIPAIFRNSHVGSETVNAEENGKNFSACSYSTNGQQSGRNVMDFHGKQHLIHPSPLFRRNNSLSRSFYLENLLDSPANFTSGTSLDFIHSFN
jgi:hypothetical protein